MGNARNHGQDEGQVRQYKSSPSKENNSGNDGNNNNNNNNSGGNNTTRCADGRRHCARRRRAGETRLRESQSLNRITEVQEADHATCIDVQSSVTPVIANCCGPTQENDVNDDAKVKRKGRLLLPNWSHNEPKLISIKGIDHFRKVVL